MLVFREDFNSKRYTHSNVHSSTSYNSPDMEAGLMSINRGVEEEDAVHNTVKYYTVGEGDGGMI